MTRRLMLVNTAAAQAAPAIDGGTAISGQIVAFGEEFERWGVRLKYEPGSIRLPESGAQSVKLCVQHDTDRPIGYCTSITETATGLNGTFEVPPMQHTAAYRDEIDNWVRDGLSVGVMLDQDCVDTVEEAMWARLMDGGVEQAEPITLTGELGETSTVTIPQFDSARIDHSRQGGTMPRTLVTTSAEPDTQAPAPAAAPPGAARIGTAQTRPVSAARELAVRLLSARMDGGFEAVRDVVNTALVDITPAGNGVGKEDAGLVVQALGELWSGAGYEPLYTPITANKTLTSWKYTGWRWALKPGVADYAGNKTDIPSSPATLEEHTETAERIAGGNDIDRIYKDLGDPEILTSYWRLMVDDLAKKLDLKRLGAVQGIAVAGAAQPSLIAALQAGAIAVPNANYALVSNDVWYGSASLPESEMPAAFGSGAFSMKIPPMIPSPDLPAATVIVGRSGAVDFRTFEPPIKLEAVNVAKAGIDTGLYSYWLAFPNDTATGAASYAIVPPPPAARASSK